MEKLKFITSCEVCGNNTLISVLDLGLHPLCDDLIPIGDSTSCIEYPIDIVYCPKCHTAHQRYQVEKQRFSLVNIITEPRSPKAFWMACQA